MALGVAFSTAVPLLSKGISSGGALSTCARAPFSLPRRTASITCTISTSTATAPVNTDIQRLHPGSHHSEGVVHNGVLYLSGVTSDLYPSTQVYEQAKQVLNDIDKKLLQFGTNRSRILSANVYLKNIEDVDQFNNAWNEFIPHHSKPARTTLQTVLRTPELAVEVQVTAAMASEKKGFEVRTNNAAPAVGAYSQAVRTVDGVVYISGCIALTCDGNGLIQGGDDAAEQTRIALNNVKEIVKEAGGSLKNVVKTTVLLSDIRHFSEVNTVYQEAFRENECLPARACFAAKQLPKNALVEIEAVAVI